MGVPFGWFYTFNAWDVTPIIKLNIDVGQCFEIYSLAASSAHAPWDTKEACPTKNRMRDPHNL
jgi:hypothetical protein